jgi:Trk K+ transport system NAD-binding subunit
MLVVKIDDIDTKTFETAGAGFFDVFRFATDDGISFIVATVAEFGAKEDVVSAACLFEPFA